ncbi:unnamed protein product [Notodromas monacha]|uniref:serine C-palmitoyltransferase n=1 Tax=Notodromas monacha TaxID=399045 RepID=A0A7R9BKA5_9CRUS|nr:unnamed protein product [Notodromas monacha]CAG0915682.1 unnamed protein product [Notodromas monacha]
MVACATKAARRPTNGHIGINGFKTHIRYPSADVSFAALTTPVENKKFDFQDDRESREQVSLSAAFLTYFSYGLLTVVGYVLEGLAKLGIGGHGLMRDPRVKEGIAPLYANFESFFTRHIYRRIRDCWNRPICSVPGCKVLLKDRYTPDNGWTFNFTGTTTECINMGSYNYLGFAENVGPCCRAAAEAIRTEGLTLASSISELGVGRAVRELEILVAEFLGLDDALVFGMGFATNSLNLPALVSKGCLIISDQWNHASLILGSRLSGASIRVFQHNNMASLEQVLKDSIIQGQPRTKRPWKKILIVVEGIYSMEGTIVNLPGIIELKKRYKAYLYLDEAHSIGAIGPRGRGITDYFGIDPKEVDIMMGTFTKSFGSAGGYIAGKKSIVQYLRSNSHATSYAAAMSPPVAQQIISSMRIIMGKDGDGEGLARIKALAANSRYFRRRLTQLGFIVYGHDDSPVVPLILYQPAKIAEFVRLMTKKGVAVVGVGFPATPLIESRARFCLSAGHTREMLDTVLEATDAIGDKLLIKYSMKPGSKKAIKYEL